METTSESHETNIDRFTSLPEHVAHKIITLLSMEDISRLSVVSRKCRQLCIFMPSLTVDDGPYFLKETKRTMLMNYVDRLLLLRGGMVTHCFDFTWNLELSSLSNGGNQDEYRVLSWLHNAVICKVKNLVLSLKLKRRSEFALPPTLFHSTSLDSLKISISRDGILELPSYFSIGFSSLKSLTLTAVQIDESFCNGVSTRCNFLDRLFLSHIKKTKSIVINSSSLTTLYITSRGDNKLCHLQVSAKILKHITLLWKFNSNRTLQLSVPKLKTFVWRGHIINVPFMENIACLRSVPSISFASSASTLISQNLIRLYCSVRRVDSQYLFDSRRYRDLSKQGRLPIVLTSSLAAHVLFTISVSEDLVQIVESLFKQSSTPYRYLYIWKKVLPNHTKATEMGDCGSTEYCDAQNGTTFMQNLRFVTIELISQGKNELKVIKYLLENAKYLQQMTILYAPPLGLDINGEIRGQEKASVNVAFKYQQL